MAGIFIGSTEGGSALGESTAEGKCGSNGESVEGKSGFSGSNGGGGMNVVVGGGAN